MIIFEYGYEQYLKQIRTYQRLVRRNQNSPQQQLIVSANSHYHDTHLADNESSATLIMTSAYSWKSYSSNIAAVVALICLTASKVPLVYDYMTIYRLSEDSLVFVSLISDAVYFFYWILIWFVFTLKQNWTFLIQHPFIYFRDVAIDSTDNSKSRGLLVTSNTSMFQQQQQRRHSSGSTLPSGQNVRRHYPSSSLLSRGSSPTKSLMDIHATSGPGYNIQHNARLSRPMSALVNPQMISHGLSSPSLPNCHKNFDGHGAPNASSTLHMYRQSMRDKNFQRGGTLGIQNSQQNGGLLGLPKNPKRMSLQAKHFSALNGFALPNARQQNNNSNQPENSERLNGWGITTSGPAADMIPEDSTVDSFKPHVPLKLSGSTTCYQLDSNGKYPSLNSLHESRSDFLLVSSASQQTTSTASFASIPSVIKKRPPPPPRPPVNQQEQSSSSPNEGSTMTTSTASQV